MSHFPEELAPTQECSNTEDLAQNEPVDGSVESAELDLSVGSTESQELPLESLAVEDVAIEAAGHDTANQVPVIDDNVLDVEIEEIEEDETSTTASAQVPFNPEEVSIEAEDEPTMNFSADEQTAPQRNLAKKSRTESRSKLLSSQAASKSPR